MLIDAHSHLYPRSYIELLRARGRRPRVVGDVGDEHFVFFASEEVAGGRPIDSSYWDVAAKLDFMSKTGIDQSVVSLGNPWLDAVEPEEAPVVARRLNAEFSALEGATGGRIIGMGVLPQADIASAAAVAEEISSCPTLHAVANGCRLCGRELDDPELDPVWTILERARLPIVIHPHHSVADEALAEGGATLVLAIGFPTETTIAVARLVLGGVLTRFPRLRLIVAHGGGTLPYLAGRLDAFWRADPRARARLDVAPSSEFSKLFLDAVVYAPAPLRTAADLVGPSQLLFGTDHPFAIADVAGNLATIEKALAATDVQTVCATTAAVLFDLPQLD
jgi:aminocarboxymuconate-semialdehyde decarboxylase